MSTKESNLMGKSQFLLLNPTKVRAHREAVEVIGVQRVRISIRARKVNSIHKKAGYMTDALFSSNKSLDAHSWSIHDLDIFSHKPQDKRLHIQLHFLVDRLKT